MELESSFGAEERSIERPFSEEEIKIAVFSIEESISQIDSQRVFFFSLHKCWEIIRKT